MSENTDPLADHVPVYEDDVRGDRVVGTVQVCAATGDPWPCAAVTPDEPPPVADDLREKVEALADDMDERGKPGEGDSPTDAIQRRQIREDAGRLRALLRSTEPAPVDELDQ